MPGPFPSDLLLGNFNTTTVADDPFVTDPLVLAAVAFPVFYRPEDPFAKQSVTFGFVGPVIDGFGLQYLAIDISRILSGKPGLS